MNPEKNVFWGYRRRGRLWVMILFVCAAVGAATGSGSALAVEDSSPIMIPASFSSVAEKASPAVVNISTVKRVTTGGTIRRRGPLGPDEQFREFFERFFGDQGPTRERKERSLGTGFIIDPSGLTITNNHVVEGAEDILIRMSNGEEHKAVILGRDPKTDLALLKIEAKTALPDYLTLGDSESLKIGDWVVAIGNPFGLEHTVTAGILSARGRAIGAGPYDDFLQTDASINPGNSGGPLLNLKGEVIGINTAIIAGGNGIGFAIPTSLARGIVSQLKDKGRVVRGWLGVMIQKITPELARSFDLENESGALVADVTPGGPADMAGLKRGDVIVGFNGRTVKEFSELPAMVAETPVKAKVDVVVVRGGKEITIPVVIGELKEDKSPAEPTSSRDLGLTVKELTPEIAQKLGLAEIDGVIITAVADDSPAAESGLKPGDLIVEINRQPVKTMDDYNRLTLGVKSDETVLFLIRRGANTLFFTLGMD